MTELFPNDLSHMSDGDFNALCPQGHHAPGAEPLSHAAQAVLDAYWTDKGFIIAEDINKSIAAALRAAADQAVPPALEEEFIDRNQALPLTKMVEIRRHLYAIAAELEGQ